MVVIGTDQICRDLAGQWAEDFSKPPMPVDQCPEAIKADPPITERHDEPPRYKKAKGPSPWSDDGPSRSRRRYVVPTSSERTWRRQIPAVRLRNAYGSSADEQRRWRLRAMDGDGGKAHRSLRNDAAPMIAPFPLKPNRNCVNHFSSDFAPQWADGNARYGCTRTIREDPRLP